MLALPEPAVESTSSVAVTCSNMLALLELACTVAPLTCMMASLSASLSAAPGEMPLPVAVVVTCSTCPTSGVCVRLGALDATGGCAAFSPQAARPKAILSSMAGIPDFIVIFIGNSIVPKKKGEPVALLSFLLRF